MPWLRAEGEKEADARGIQTGLQAPILPRPGLAWPAMCKTLADADTETCRCDGKCIPVIADDHHTPCRHCRLPSASPCSLECVLLDTRAHHHLFPGRTLHTLHHVRCHYHHHHQPRGLLRTLPPCKHAKPRPDALCRLPYRIRMGRSAIACVVRCPWSWYGLHRCGDTYPSLTQLLAPASSTARQWTCMPCRTADQGTLHL